MGDLNIQSILVSLGSVLLAIVLYAAREGLLMFYRRITKTKAKDKLKDSTTRDQEVTALITALRLHIDSDRSYIFQFHNGMYFTSRQPGWRLSCTHETINSDRGITFESPNLQNLWASSLIEVISPFWGTDTKGVLRIDKGAVDPVYGVYYYVVADMDESLSKNHLVAQDIVTLIASPLVSPDDGRVIGLVGIDFTGKSPKPMQTNLTVIGDTVKRCACTIAYHLTRSKPGDAPTA